MLLNPLDHMNDGDLTKAIVPALVIDNNDPEGKQRIKCRISIVHQGVIDDHLPWCRPIKSDSLGSSGVQTIRVPQIGSIAAVYIGSEDDNTNNYYLGVFSIDGTLPAAFMSIYPHCYGFVDENGSMFIVNTSAKTVAFYHCLGATLLISGSTINIVSSGAANVHAMGDANIYATGNVNIDGTSINLNGGSNGASGLTTSPQPTPHAPPTVTNLTDY